MEVLPNSPVSCLGLAIADENRERPGVLARGVTPALADRQVEAAARQMEVANKVGWSNTLLDRAQL